MGINFFENEVIINLFGITIENEKEDSISSKSNVFIICTISENGCFVNPKPIGNYAEDEELIEFLKRLS